MSAWSRSKVARRRWVQLWSWWLRKSVRPAGCRAPARPGTVRCGLVIRRREHGDDAHHEHAARVAERELVVAGIRARSTGDGRAPDQRAGKGRGPVDHLECVVRGVRHVVRACRELPHGQSSAGRPRRCARSAAGGALAEHVGNTLVGEVIEEAEHRRPDGRRAWATTSLQSSGTDIVMPGSAWICFQPSGTSDPAWRAPIATCAPPPPSLPSARAPTTSATTTTAASAPTPRCRRRRARARCIAAARSGGRLGVSAVSCSRVRTSVVIRPPRRDQVRRRSRSRRRAGRRRATRRARAAYGSSPCSRDNA